MEASEGRRAVGVAMATALSLGLAVDDAIVLHVLAMITTWRRDRDDQFPDGRRLGTEWLAQLRTALRPDTPG